MPQEAFCPEHGPYDASLGACPYPHNSGVPRPGMPPSLEDDFPTDLGGAAPMVSGGTAPTMPPDQGFQSGDEDETQAPARRSSRGILDYDAEDETELPRSAREDVTELDAPIRGTLGMLWVKEGARRGRFYPIKNGTTIGRKDGDLILDDPKVSSSHAKFTMDDDDFLLWDFGSANGTYVNGKKIRQATLLVENDLIKIGETVFVVKLLDPKPKRRPARSTEKSSGTRKTRKAR
jgi:hypothetical protein